MNRPAAPDPTTQEGYDPEKDLSIVHDSRRSRPKYFEGQFLTARDLNSEQEYLLARQADFARALGFGVVEGLRVMRREKRFPGEEGASTKLDIGKGVGITPAGEVVQLPEDRVVDLSEIGLMRELNARFGLAQEPQQPFASLDGLFVFGLRQVEFTANPTPVFPASLDGRNQLRDGEIVEATAFTLVPYASTAADESRPEQTLARVAREIFHDGRPPASPGNVLPLAVVLLRGGVLVWVDEFLVRREAGDDDRFGFGFAPRALAEAHFHHYRKRIEDAELPLDSRRVAAADHFEVLPPGGPLPPGVVDAAAFTQTYFPPEARVDIAIVPEDELPVLMDESLDLPPVDLRLKIEDNDALAILILAPVPRRLFDDQLETVEPKPLLPGIGSPSSVALPASLASFLKTGAQASMRKASARAVAPASASRAAAAPMTLLPVRKSFAPELELAREDIGSKLKAVLLDNPNVSAKAVENLVLNFDETAASISVLGGDVESKTADLAKKTTTAINKLKLRNDEEALFAGDDEFEELRERIKSIDPEKEPPAEETAELIAALLRRKRAIELVGSKKQHDAIDELEKKLGELVKDDGVVEPPAVTPTPTPPPVTTPPTVVTQPPTVGTQPPVTGTSPDEVDDEPDDEFVSDPIADSLWTKALSVVPKFWYVRRRNLPPPGLLAGKALAVTGTTTEQPQNEEPAPAPVLEDDETPEMMKALADAKLDGSYLSLRLLTSLREHEALARMVSTLIDAHPRIVLHEAIERLVLAMKLDPDTPSKNFDLMLRADPKPRLTTEIIKKVQEDVTATSFAKDIARVLGSEALNDSAIAEPLARSGQLSAIAAIAQKQGVKQTALDTLRDKLLHHAQRRRPSDITSEVKLFVTPKKGGTK